MTGARALRLALALFVATALGAAAADDAPHPAPTPRDFWPREPGGVQTFRGEQRYCDAIVMRRVDYVIEYLGPAPCGDRVAEKSRELLTIHQSGEEYTVDSFCFTVVDDAEMRVVAYQMAGSDTLGALEADGEVVLRAPLREGQTWTNTTSELLTLAQDAEVTGFRSRCAIVATDSVVEVPAGVFPGCLVTRRIGRTDEPFTVVGLSGRKCLASIEYEVETTFAPGVGIIRSVKRERAIPAQHPDSVFAHTVYRNELVRDERP